MAATSGASHDADQREITRGLRGSSLLFVGRCLSLVMNLAIQVAAVRYFSKAEYGLFAVAFSTVAVASVVAAFGMDKTALRVLPKYQGGGDKAKFAGATFVMAISAAASSLLVIAGVYLGWLSGLLAMDNAVGTKVLLVLIWMTPCNVLDCLTTSLFSVFGNPGAIFFRQHVVGPVLRVLAVVAVIACGGGIVAFALGQLIASALGFGYYLLLVRTMVRGNPLFVPFRWSDAKATCRSIFSYSLTLIFGDLAFLLRGAMVVIVVNYFYDPAEAAGFQAVFPAARLNDVVIATFTVLFMPSASRLFAAGAHGALNDLYCRTITWTTVFSFPIFLASLVYSSEICVLLFGKAYADSGPVLAVLSLGFFINAICGMNLRLIRVVSSLRTLLAVDAVSVVAAIGLNFLLVPGFGALGGAYAVMLSFLVQSVCCQFAVWQSVRLNPVQWRLLKTYALAGLAAVGVWQFQTVVRPPIELSLVVAALASFGLLFLSRRELDIVEVFPEVARAPLIGRLFLV